MSEIQIHTTPSWRPMGFWGVKALVATAFLSAGVLKVAGTQQMIDLFEAIGFGQWFRIFTGLIEVGGAVLLLLPASAFTGAALLAATMYCAVVLHLTLLTSLSPVPAAVLLVLTGAIAFVHRDQLTDV
ncbi:DoxX family protein [Bradyrhizobium sp. Pear76]|uniref:DoxX family protein n=1 Tax=Bradyrhizobium oropedii TaxID=1571201 RepID=UPI001E296D2F|nr:DoxX family protein [Bradyrhizobium oropedii]MCC8964289.1 DoxX family protein [Bradyrhizobium oropedii]